MSIDLKNPSLLRSQTAISDRNRLNFGYRVLVDSGASKPNNGSFKISIRSDHGQELFSSDNVHDDEFKLVCPEGFTKSQDYADGIAERIKQSINMIIDKIANLKGEDKKLSGIVVNVPCPVIGNQSKQIANLKDKNGKSLTNVNFNNIEKLIKQTDNINLSENFRLIATNDMPGAVAGVAQILTKDDKFKKMIKEGFYGAILMAGGGLGVADLKVKNNYLEIEASESGHNRVLNSDKNIEKEGASVPALIANYTNELGINEKDTQKLINLGLAEIVTQRRIILDNDSQKYKLIKNTGLFDIEDQNMEKATFVLAGISANAHKQASKKAIEKFIDSIAQLSATKATQGINLIILAGPLTEGINKTISQNSRLFEGKSLEKLVKEKTYQYLDPIGKSMADMYQFNVTCDIKVKNNTIGGELLLKSDFIGNDNRGNWINIPIDTLKS